jgi:Raf kinase inhibitor-like YbhB/YbcL family protein
MRLLSPAFHHQGDIPERYTCSGLNVNPELYVEDIPAGTRDMALLVYDPDAVGGEWVHWIVYGMGVVSEIPEDSIPGTQGTNSFGRLDYGGPCPPEGRHRFVFSAYALDTGLRLGEGKSREELTAAMEGHVLARADLVGLYRKPPVPVKQEEIYV